MCPLIIIERLKKRYRNPSSKHIPLVNNHPSESWGARPAPNDSIPAHAVSPCQVVSALIQETLGEPCGRLTPQPVTVFRADADPRTPEVNQLGTVGVPVPPLDALLSLPLAKPIVGDLNVPQNRTTPTSLALGCPLGLWVVIFEDCRPSGAVGSEFETISLDDLGGNRAPGSLEKVIGELR